jgi:hypothetical protein
MGLVLLLLLVLLGRAALAATTTPPGRGWRHARVAALGRGYTGTHSGCGRPPTGAAVGLQLWRRRKGRGALGVVAAPEALARPLLLLLLLRGLILLLRGVILLLLGLLALSPTATPVGDP